MKMGTDLDLGLRLLLAFIVIGIFVKFYYDNYVREDNF